MRKVTLTADTMMRIPVQVMYKESTPGETSKGDREAGQRQEESKQGCNFRGTLQGSSSLMLLGALGVSHTQRLLPSPPTGPWLAAPTPEGIETPGQLWLPANAQKAVLGTEG